VCAITPPRPLPPRQSAAARAQSRATRLRASARARPPRRCLTRDRRACVARRGRHRPTTRGRHPAKKRVRRVIRIAPALRASWATHRAHATAAPPSATRGLSERIVQAAALPNKRTGRAATPPNVVTVLPVAWASGPTAPSEIRLSEATAQRAARPSGATVPPDARPSAPTVPLAGSQPTVAIGQPEAPPSAPVAPLAAPLSAPMVPPAGQPTVVVTALREAPPSAPDASRAHARSQTR